MANQSLGEFLIREGVGVWNKWRREEPAVRLDLSGESLIGTNLEGVNLIAVDLREAELTWANLHRATLIRADLSKANLEGVNLTCASLSRANLHRADLTRAILNKANLVEVDLSRANLVEADLEEANFTRARLVEADLSRADLTGTMCLKTTFSGATLTGCTVYGISAWDLNLDDVKQADLRITPLNKETSIAVDNLEVAQFLYLLLSNQKVRNLLDTITSKVVLILGRFSPERKPVLDALREALRLHPNGYIPVSSHSRTSRSWRR